MAFIHCHESARSIPSIKITHKRKNPHLQARPVKSKLDILRFNFEKNCV